MRNHNKILFIKKFSNLNVSRSSLKSNNKFQLGKRSFFGIPPDQNTKSIPIFHPTSLSKKINIEPILEEKPIDNISKRNEIELFSSISSSDLLDYVSNFDGSKEEYNPKIKIGPFLTKFGVNLTSMAVNGSLDPVIGRDVEINRMFQILCRRIKNNPVLVGDPGVGKTAVIEGVAQKIVSGNVPSHLKNCVIISLDMAGIIAGAKFRGEFEDRLKGVVREVESSDNKIILFIDELHIIVGAGGAEGAIDAANLIKPSLARGTLKCIGATTQDEYSKYIEKDGALARRFQQIFVDEPTITETINILKGLRKTYESYHGITISDDSIESAVRLTQRYIPDRKLPDKVKRLNYYLYYLF
jgi:ATP-dependent Clp protease ATP-binding subunit ClpA